MTTRLLSKRGWWVALLAGAMPLATVADCGFSPGRGGTFFYDQGGDDFFFDDHGRGSVVIIDEFGYDEVVYEEDVFFEEVFYEDDYCDPLFFWDCW